ncbi:carboxyphosphonoenolpyruvate phosphonomutase-like protein [Dentipellis sp. KUC8613]|nr:carboxyphosphonoenolpyruvate phosphonomutase-like protein [Dentipellis sp. KUC8613]
MSTSQNALAQKFAALHNPHDTLILANAFDGGSAHAVASNPRTKAIASASYAVAVAGGYTDDGLTLAQNIAGVRAIVAAGVSVGKPVTVDLQDGYGEQLADAIAQVIALGAVGCNLEDFDRGQGKLWSVEDAAARIRKAKRVAAELGVPDFVVNARTDVLAEKDATIADAVQRGKAYLAAGATTVFVWGGLGGRGVSREEVGILVKELGGMVNVSMRLAPGYLTAQELSKIGVARISVGPGLYRVAIEGFAKAVDGVYGST